MTVRTAELSTPITAPDVTSKKSSTGRNLKILVGSAAVPLSQLACAAFNGGTGGQQAETPTSVYNTPLPATQVTAETPANDPVGAFIDGLIPNGGSITATPGPTETSTQVATVTLAATNTAMPATETSTQVATATQAATNTAMPSPTLVETATPAVAPTEAFKGNPEDRALLEAAQNLARKTHEDVNMLYQEYVALFNGMPVMDNVATSSDAALMPTADTAHNLTEKTYNTKVNAGGYMFLSTSFADLDIDGQKLSFPWKADDNRLIFVMGSEDGSTQKNVTIEKYPQGNGYTANATPDDFQKGMLKGSDRSVYDVWLADQIMQTCYRSTSNGSRRKELSKNVQHDRSRC
ncbi:MAG: hypothetical protein NTV98_05785 [Candidatus Roizmanbacteria bacterium]|nr:hypothetical protein [Candidatus Roizmanbacteria bacterium]